MDHLISSLFELVINFIYLTNNIDQSSKPITYFHPNIHKQVMIPKHRNLWINYWMIFVSHIIRARKKHLKCNKFLIRKSIKGMKKALKRHKNTKVQEY